MRSMLALACFAFVALPCGIAAAEEPAYNSADIVNHFAPAIEAGATRGICIGTETECGAQEPGSAVANVASYDLLITFDLDSAMLTEEAKANLDQFAEALRDPRLSQASFEVGGHTDARGADNYNLNLSEERAQAVIAYLASKGVDTSKLIARGFGKTQPRTEDPFDAVNRRVETRLVVQ